MAAVEDMSVAGTTNPGMVPFFRYCGIEKGGEPNAPCEAELR